jgi:hypothetical protein
MLDFPINPTGEISNIFLDLGISNFQDASIWIASLPYRRNSSKTNLKVVFQEKYGTCSTKHAILKTLADENNFEGLDLILGIFELNNYNAPKISTILQKYNLQYIPEAHNYLFYKQEIYDFTFPNLQELNFKEHLLMQCVISPSQISDFKIDVHKNYIKSWLKENYNIKYSLDEIWEIRELCIKALY